MRIYLNDIFIILSIGMFLTAHVVTVIVINKAAGPLPERAEEIINALEASPVAKITLQFTQYRFILQLILVPALIGGFYYALRRRLWVDDRDKELVLSGFAGVMFLAALINVVNDLAVLVAYW